MDLVHCTPPLGHLSKNGVLSLYLPRSWINDADNQQTKGSNSKNYKWRVTVLKYWDGEVSLTDILTDG